MFQKILSKTLIYSCDKPKVVLFYYLLLLCYCAYILFLGITLKSSNLDLLPHNAKAVQSFERLAQQYGTPNSIIVVVESKFSKIRVQVCESLQKDLLKISGIGSVVFKRPLPDEMLQENDLKKYFEGKDYQILFLQPNDPRSSIDQLVPLIYKVQSLIDQYKSKEVSLHLTGLPILAKDDQSTILNDLPLLGFVSLIMIAFFMLRVLKNYGFVLLGFVTLLVACVLSLSLTSFVPGHLNLLSSTFLAISFGLNVDYLIHFVYAFLEDTELITPQNLKQALFKVLPSMSASCLSTAGVFFIIAFTEFKGFAELGLTAGCSLIIGLFTYYSFFPALLLGCNQKIKSPQAKDLNLFFIVKPKYAILVFTVSIALCFVAKFEFDGNYLNLQPLNSETVLWEKQLSKDGLYSSNTYLIEKQGAENAFELSEKLREFPEIAKVESLVELESLLEVEDRMDLLTPNILKKFKDKNDNYLLYVLPSIDLWEDQIAQKLNAKLRDLHVEVTGLPILAELITKLSIESLYDSFYMSLIFLFTLLLFEFKNFKLSFIAIVPSVLTSIGLLGILALCSSKLNSISMIALPLILGLALDDGIYICHSMAKSIQEKSRTNSAVIFTSITTILSFGCLIFTHHRGVASFGFNIAIGVFLAMIYSLTMVPLFYKVLSKSTLK